MKPHQIQDARDRAFALRAEARQPISYERIKPAGLGDIFGDPGYLTK